MHACLAQAGCRHSRRCRRPARVVRPPHHTIGGLAPSTLPAHQHEAHGEGCSSSDLARLFNCRGEALLTPHRRRCCPPAGAGRHTPRGGCCLEALHGGLHIEWAIGQMLVVPARLLLRVIGC